ncbi:MAG TPA: AgmX/PglI C-terminal domain-containing protein [Kofleriaceae bacterium]|nr:AgmX/PglI C-terminal domain-containing protein [Kofleriaceae bacterium]
MKRGIAVAVVCLVVGAALASCKKPGAKKRVPDGEKASAGHLIRTIDAVGAGDESLLLLGEGVSEVCGKGCECLANAAKADDGDTAKHLYACPSLCTADARAKALAAPPGQRFATLTGACTPEAIGLTADAAKKVGDDWVAAFVSGQYLADAYDGANADDRKAYDAAFAKFSVPLAPTAGMAGVALAGATKTEWVGRTRTFVAIDAKGAIATGTMHQARFTPTGAMYIPADLKAFADVSALDKQLNSDKAALAAPPPPEPEPEAEADEEDVGGTGTAMALEEGKMGKKDSDRAEGQYKMKNNPIDEQLAREQAIEQARSAGILGDAALKQGGAFATLTGTGDITAGFDDRDVYGAFLGTDDDSFAGLAPQYSVVGVTSTPIRDQVVVIADKDAPAMTLLGVMSVVPEGTVLAVEQRGALAALPFVFTQGGFGFARLPDRDGTPVDLRISVGDGVYTISASVSDDITEVKAGDDAALVAAIKKVLDEPLFADRRDVKLLVQSDTKVAHVVTVLDAALGAGARSARMESGGGWGPIGHGSGTIGQGNGYGPGVHDAPSVSIGQPAAVGDLDKAIIRRYIKRNIPKITYCYEKQLLVKPKLEGTVTAQFFISPSGAVASSNASGVDVEVASCVAAVIKSIEFPKPKGGGGVQVNYPFNFRSK